MRKFDMKSMNSLKKNIEKPLFGSHLPILPQNQTLVHPKVPYRFSLEPTKDENKCELFKNKELSTITSKEDCETLCGTIKKPEGIFHLLLVSRLNCVMQGNNNIVKKYKNGLSKPRQAYRKRYTDGISNTINTKVNIIEKIAFSKTKDTILGKLRVQNKGHKIQ